MLIITTPLDAPIFDSYARVTTLNQFLHNGSYSCLPLAKSVKENSFLP